MKRLGALLILGIIAASINGCASAGSDEAAASAETSAASECRRHGGVWRPAFNFCEGKAPEAGGY
jgi:hypothetical protein